MTVQKMTAEWRRFELPLGDVGFPYAYGTDCVDRITAEVGALDADRLLLVTDDRVLDLHGEVVIAALAKYAAVHVLTGPPGEQRKTFGVLSDHLEQVIAAGASRRSVVVTLGGGVVGNLEGLLASLLFRGVRLVHIPTTLMAAADSTISLKQAINTPTSKNTIGTYHRPTAVLVDIALFATLPPDELRSGLCESVKNCLAIRPTGIDPLLGVLREDRPITAEAYALLLRESIQAKCAVMHADPYEREAAIVLEYGHTIGHAIEVADRTAPADDRIRHGDAVALGIHAAALISARRGWLDERDVEMHRALLSAVGAPSVLPGHLQPERIVQAVVHDNKRGYIPCSDREVPLALLRDLGIPASTANRPLVPVDMDVVAQAVEALCGGAASRRGVT